MSDILDLLKGIPAHRQAAKRAAIIFDQSDRFVIKSGAGPFIGKRGGKWADSDHTIPWKEGKAPSKQRKNAHGGSSRGFLNDHKNTTHEEHSNLAQKHQRLANDSRSASRKERDGSNAQFAHKHEAMYHDSMASAHQHMKVGKNSYRGIDKHDERAATQARGHAAEMKQWAEDAHAGVEASKPPRNSRGDLHSMGSTATGKKMAFLSRENFRDHTDGWSNEDHDEAANEHRARAEQKWALSDQLQTEGKWEEASKHNKAGRYHDQMDRVHLHAALGGTNETPHLDPGDRGDLSQAAHAQSVSTPGRLTDLAGTKKAMVKGGEGSRGGDVVGHTGSGQPIYASHKSVPQFHARTKGWSRQDHTDAGAEFAKIHSKGPSRGGRAYAAQHVNSHALNMSNAHGAMLMRGGSEQNKLVDGSVHASLTNARNALHYIHTNGEHKHAHPAVSAAAKEVGTKKAMGDDHDLTKGGGWMKIGKHGGERKQGTYGHWEYRYPSKKAASHAAKHHENEREKASDKIDAHRKERGPIGGPNFDWDKHEEHGEAEEEKLYEAHSHHAAQRDAAQHFAQHGHGPATHLDSYDSHGSEEHGEYDDEERQRGWNYAHPRNDTHGYTVTQSGESGKFEVHHGKRHGQGHVEASEHVGTERSREQAMALVQRHASLGSVSNRIKSLEAKADHHDKMAESSNPSFPNEAMAASHRKRAANLESLKAMDDNHDLVKAAPYIGPKGGKWNDAQHKIPYNEKKHEVEARSTGRFRSGGGQTNSTATVFMITDPHEPGGKADHEYIAGGKTPAARRTEALRQHKEKHGIDREIKHTDFDKKAAAHNRKATEKTRGEATAGTHHVADRDGGFRKVKTSHSAGHYAVHKDDSARTGTRRYSVTHTPSGASLGVFGNKQKAKQMANHMHEHAGDAGGDTKFGKMPSKVEMGKMQEAHAKFGKAMDDNDLQKAIVAYDTTTEKEN